MYKSSYLNKIFRRLKNKYKNEKEYLSAIEEFFDSVDYLIPLDKEIEKNAIIERIVEPERSISFRVPWVNDKGKIEVNTGYRIEFNSAIGPYKGGIRFDKSVNTSILKFLGFEQTFKNSLTGLPMGGGKGGSDFDPNGKSDGEIMRFCQSFISELYRHIGPNTDVPAGDIGVGAREIGYMFGYYKKLTNEFTGAFTGKDINYGGSLCRPEATGYGLLYFVQEMLSTFKKDDIKGKKVIISGSGKVGGMALEKAVQLGAIVVAMSDKDGCVYEPTGLDYDFIIEHSKKSGKFSKEYAACHKNATYSANCHDLWKLPCDIALPCATQGEIHLEDAVSLKNNDCYMVVEGANMPCDVEAIRYFNSHNILFAPGKAANAGGVAVSGLEMAQNAMHMSWTFEEVDEKLKGIMKDIFNKCYKTACQYGEPTNIALGANIAGFIKVYKAMLAEGVC